MRFAAVAGVVGGVLGSAVAWSLLGDGGGALEPVRQAAVAQLDVVEGVLERSLREVTELVDTLPGWVVITGLVVTTLGGVALAAALARPGTATTSPPRTDDPGRWQQRRRPPHGWAPTARSSKPPARRGAHALRRGRSAALVVAATRSTVATVWPTLVAIRHRVRSAWRSRRHRPLQVARIMLRTATAGVVRGSRRAGAAATRVLRAALRSRRLGPDVGAIPGAAAPDRHARARQVHAEVGGEWTLLRHLADRMVAARAQSSRDLRALTRPLVVTAWTLGALPLAVLAGRLLLDAHGMAALASGVRFPLLAVALLLSVLGAGWVHRLARPPFSAHRAARHAYERERAQVLALAEMLEHSALYAAADVPLADALRRSRRRAVHPAAEQLARWIADRRSDVVTIPDSVTPLGRCIGGLERWLADGAPAEEALAASAARLRHEHRLRGWRGLGPALAGMLVPAAVCALPAALLLAVV